VSDVDDLVAALIKGDPGETVPLDIVTAMAKSALRHHWIPCIHDDIATMATFENDRAGTLRWCTQCQARFAVVVEPEGQ
jgi:hypothetical protein